MFIDGPGICKKIATGLGATVAQQGYFNTGVASSFDPENEKLGLVYVDNGGASPVLKYMRWDSVGGAFVEEALNKTKVSALITAGEMSEDQVRELMGHELIYSEQQNFFA